MLKKHIAYICVCSIIAVVITQCDIYGILHTRDTYTPRTIVPPILHEPEPVISFTVDSNELECMATNVYHESRGESVKGQLAVAHVTLNRVEDENYPDNVCDVVYQAKYSTWWLETKGRLVPVRWKCQFTWYCDGKSDFINKSSSAWEQALYISTNVLTGNTDDPTAGATHYFNHHIANPHWSKFMTEVARIDNHAFFYYR
jgi:N-acetylmuramoyl-L-alanine amidase